jgi:hypothetical protein
MTERIDHRKRAEGLIASIYGKRESPVVIQSLAVVAQAEATLALVEQQRIANIFTLQSGAVNACQPVVDMVFDRNAAGDPLLKPEIAEALGVGKGEES